VGHDETALAVARVRYVGDNVACVVATSEAIAEQALELIEVDYELLPAWFDPEQSMQASLQSEGDDWIQDHRPHTSKRSITRSSEIPEPGLCRGRICHRGPLSGQRGHAAAMEPHCALAAYEIDPRREPQED